MLTPNFFHLLQKCSLPAFYTPEPKGYCPRSLQMAKVRSNFGSNSVYFFVILYIQFVEKQKRVTSK